ncbi:MAG: endonuclease V [Methanobacterium sp.]
MSIGHKISLKTAIELFKETSIFKTPEPIRQAHILATRAFKEILK